jgi:DNA-binding IclR family transcriptional regulator
VRNIQKDPTAANSGELPDRVPPCAVAKAVLLLSQLDGQAPVGLASLTRTSDIPKSTIRRILNTLCTTGMVRHTDSGYTLGPLVAMLGRRTESSLPEPLLQLIMPHLLTLHYATHGVACLGVLCGTEVTCLQTLHREADVPLARRLLRTAPAGHIALGKALLGQQPDTIYVDSHDNLVVLAAAVTDHLNRPLASIAVAGPVGRFTVDSATTHVRTATSGATRAIRPLVTKHPEPHG